MRAIKLSISFTFFTAFVSSFTFPYTSQANPSTTLSSTPQGVSSSALPYTLQDEKRLRPRHSRHRRPHSPSHSPSSSPSSSDLPRPSSTSGTYLAGFPRWVVYSNMGSNDGAVVPRASELGGINVFILAFYCNRGPVDQVREFTSLSASQRKRIIRDLHDHGISLMMSVGGETEHPTTDGVDPRRFAREIASFVKEYELDGVDVDYEDYKAMDNGSGEAEAWIIDFTKALRSQLPSGQYLITHAPVAPWFTTDKSQYPHGAYRAVDRAVGNAIDWYNIQYYNQENNYRKCSRIITKSSSTYPGTSIKEIHTASGIPLSKLIIGKTAQPNDSNHQQDFMSGDAIAKCLQQAKQQFGWNAGTMFWQWPHASPDLIEKVRRLSFPV